MHWIHRTSKHIKRFRVQVSIPFNAKYIAFIRLQVTGGGHLEFSHEKVDGKNGNTIISKLHEKSLNVYLLHNCVYYIHFTVILTDFRWHSFIFISFIKIIVALDSFKTYKTTSSSSFYTAYCLRFSDYKTFGDRWRPS